MAKPFEDIRILGLDEDLTKSANGALYDVHLTLSATPPQEWADFFGSAYSATTHNMWRRASIEGNDIVLSCGLDEIEKYHRQPLMDAVARANSSYRAHLDREKQREAAELERNTAERDRIKEISDRLTF